MAFTPAKKGTLLVPSGPTGMHLHVILTDACQDGLHLRVPVSSIPKKGFHDPTCVIEPGEHSFIKRKSYVLYRLLTTTRAQHIVKCVKGLVFNVKDHVSNDLNDRICDGVEDSTFSPKGMIDYFFVNE